LGLPLPTLVDGMDNAAAEVFAAWPERIYILNKGKLHYTGGPGPYEFNPEEAKESLMELLNTT
ncbi:MAG: deiodinase family protein, partial [Candidatus Marinimicrobia bacterium]|nr:deiodinase family protein [Candidatus Neomarinimicrobiota bacterium]